MIKAHVVETIPPPSYTMSGIPGFTYTYRLERPLAYVDVNNQTNSGETQALKLSFSVVNFFGKWWHQVYVSGTGHQVIYNYHEQFQGTPELVMQKIGVEVVVAP